VLRLTEIAGKEETLHLDTPHLRLQHAWRCSLLEDCAQELPVQDARIELNLKPYEILTLRIETQPEAKP
jgi:alpha-mannosidase